MASNEVVQSSSWVVPTLDIYRLRSANQNKASGFITTRRDRRRGQTTDRLGGPHQLTPLQACKDAFDDDSEYEHNKTTTWNTDIIVRLPLLCSHRYVGRLLSAASTESHTSKSDSRDFPKWAATPIQIHRDKHDHTARVHYEWVS